MLWAVPRRTAGLCLSPCELSLCYYYKLNNMMHGIYIVNICMSDIVDPAFFAIMRFPLKRRDSFFYLKQKKPFLENGLESPLIFVFILKGKTK